MAIALFNVCNVMYFLHSVCRNLNCFEICSKYIFPIYVVLVQTKRVYFDNIYIYVAKPRTLLMAQVRMMDLSRTICTMKMTATSRQEYPHNHTLKRTTTPYHHCGNICMVDVLFKKCKYLVYPSIIFCTFLTSLYLFSMEACGFQPY